MSDRILYNKNTKSKWVIPLVAVIFIILALSVVIGLLGNKAVVTEIINIDGMAYIQYLDKQAKLIDELGNQVQYTEDIESKHRLVTVSSYVGYNIMIIITDKDTGINYIMLRDNHSQDINNTIVIME